MTHANENEYNSGRDRPDVDSIESGHLCSDRQVEIALIQLYRRGFGLPPIEPEVFEQRLARIAQWRRDGSYPAPRGPLRMLELLSSVCSFASGELTQF